MRGKWLLISLAALVAGAGGAALSVHWKGHASAPSRHNEAAQAPDAPEITLAGKLRPQHVTIVKPGIAGNIDALLVDVGEDVFTGEVLARIGESGMAERRDSAAAAAGAAEESVSRAERSVAGARLEASRADADRARSGAALEKARETYERQEMLHQHGATPRLTWEKAQRDLAAAQQEYDALAKASQLSAGQLQSALDALSDARKALADRHAELTTARDSLESGEVHSPVDGTVVARNGEAGSPAGDDLYEIATDMFALEAVAAAEPAALSRMRPGEPAVILIPDLRYAGISGEIKEIKDGAVIVQFSSTLAGVKAGMPVQVRLKLQ